MSLGRLDRDFPDVVLTVAISDALVETEIENNNLEDVVELISLVPDGPLVTADETRVKEGTDGPEALLEPNETVELGSGNGGVLDNVPELEIPVPVWVPADVSLLMDAVKDAVGNELSVSPLTDVSAADVVMLPELGKVIVPAVLVSVRVRTVDGGEVGCEGLPLVWPAGSGKLVLLDNGNGGTDDIPGVDDASLAVKLTIDVVSVIASVVCHVGPGTTVELEDVIVDESPWDGDKVFPDGKVLVNVSDAILDDGAVGPKIEVMLDNGKGGTDDDPAGVERPALELREMLTLSETDD